MKMKELDIAIHNAAPDEETRQNLHQTVNISKMSDEQVDALLWKDDLGRGFCRITGSSHPD